MISKMTPSGLKQVVRLRKVTSGGLKRVLRIRKMTGVGLVEVYNDVPTLSVSVSPNPASFTTTENTTVQGDVLATVTGGMSPFTYSWVVLTSSNSTAILNSATSSPTLRQTGVIAETTGTATIRVSVQDASLQTATLNFSADFTNFGGA